ncbi:MAG: DUF503 domain-containing protein [Anaerolineae bacterium]|nr:DUF503 domain-containing protein [Anaerolineae bacterium]
MVIGVCTIELHIAGCGSLKEKRGIVKSLLARLHREFNVSVAEVDLNDVWQSAAIAVVVVTNGNAHAEQTLERIVHWIEHNRPEVEVVAEQVELIK